jgi:hypothetical protein
MRGTITYLTTSSAVEHLATLDLPLKKTVLVIATSTHLCHGFDFFVLFIQAFAWNELAQELNQRVIVGFLQLLYLLSFHQGWLSLTHVRCYVLLEEVGANLLLCRSQLLLRFLCFSFGPFGSLPGLTLGLLPRRHCN